MSSQTEPRWHAMRSDRSREVEAALRGTFPETDAYEFNSASIRVRVVDQRFHGLSDEQRDSMIEPILATLPEEVQADIVNLLAIAPDEISGFSRFSLRNLEFEDPSQSRL
ncbi:MAG: hypothetical protein JSS27_02605 [Planctomycetes bacterium]|nr:hypothetical protein [Planctomycetota bacterium]